MFDWMTKRGGTSVLEEEQQAQPRVTAPPLPAPPRAPNATLEELTASHRDAAASPDLSSMYGWLAEGPPQLSPAATPEKSESSWLERAWKGLVDVDVQLPGQKREAETLPPVPEGTFDGDLQVGGDDFRQPANPADLVLSGKELGEQENAFRFKLQTLPALAEYGFKFPQASLTIGKQRTDDGRMMTGVDAGAQLFGYEKEAQQDGSFFDRTGISADFMKYSLRALASSNEHGDSSFVGGAQATQYGGGIKHYDESGGLIQAGLSEGAGMEFRGDKTTDAAGNTKVTGGADYDKYSGDLTSTHATPAATPSAAANDLPSPSEVWSPGGPSPAETKTAPSTGEYLANKGNETPWHQDEHFPGMLAPVMALLRRNQINKEEEEKRNEEEERRSRALITDNSW